MPEITMQGQTPVNVGKAFRHEECSDASQQTEIPHKSTQGSLYPALWQQGQHETQIHRQAAELKWKKPPVVSPVVDAII